MLSTLMKSIALATAGLLAAVPARAQVPSDTAAPTVLTVEAAIRTALENNPLHLQVANDIDAAATEVRQGWGAFLPSLDASLGVSGGESSRITGVDDLGRPTEVEQRQNFVNSGTTQSVGLSYTLFNGFGRIEQLRAARAGMRVAEARTAADAASWRAEISRLYYQGLRTGRLIELEENLLRAAEERLEITQQMLRVVASSPLDVLGARVDVARRRQALNRARGEADKARLALTAAMGVAPRSDVALVSEPPPVFDPAGLDAAALVAEAERSHPRVSELEAGLDAAEHRVDVARAARWPTIRASAGVSRNLEAQNYGALFDFNPPNRYFSFGLSASIPIFQQFETSASVTRAQVVLDDVNHALRARTLELARDVRSALIDLENAYYSLQLADEAAELSRERLEMAQEQYRAGAIRFTELQNVITETAGTERDALTARFEFATALATLEEMVGAEVRL